MSESDLPMALGWLDYCLGETQDALTAVKEAALESMRSPGGTPGPPPVSPEQYAAMCEAWAVVTNLRARAARGFRLSCPVPAGTQEADEPQ